MLFRSHLYAIARIIQKRERFLSVLETMDNDKPIRESRDIDIPLVARHFYHHAGWAELIADEFPDFNRVRIAATIDNCFRKMNEPMPCRSFLTAVQSSLRSL